MNIENNTEIVASDRKWSVEAINTALAAGKKPEGMSNTYWYKLRKRAGIEIERTKKNATPVETLETEKVVEKEQVSDKKKELEKRRENYAKKKDEINARRRANRAAKKAAK